MPDLNPLNARDYTELNRALRLLADTRQQIETAKAAGLECEEEDDRCKALQKALMDRKGKYFPNQP